MPDYGSMKILVIDDEVLFCETFKDILIDDGYEVLIVHKGKDALRELSSQLIHVAIIDIQLPDMSGVDILKTIKSSQLETCPIVLTGHASMKTSIEALNEGAYGYITKPYQVDEVRATVRNALERQRLLRKNQVLLETLKASNQELTAAKQQMEQFNWALENKNEHLAELDKLKSNFLAMLSHELKTPLTSIIGYSNYLLKMTPKERDREIKDGLTRISRNGYALLDLVDKLLDFSKIEAGKIEIELEEFDLQEIVEEVLLITMPMAREKNLQLTFLPNDFHEIIEADRQKIKEIFLNLVNNAVKFTEKPNSQVLIRLDAKNDFIQVVVSDQGIGIHQKDQGIVFEKFRQLEACTARKDIGAGLGLSIAKEFVDIHHGKIWVESEPQKGSNFIFQIPKRQKNWTM